MGKLLSIVWNLFPFFSFLRIARRKIGAARRKRASGGALLLRFFLAFLLITNNFFYPAPAAAYDTLSRACNANPAACGTLLRDLGGSALRAPVANATSYSNNIVNFTRGTSATLSGSAVGSAAPTLVPSAVAAGAFALAAIGLTQGQADDIQQAGLRKYNNRPCTGDSGVCLLPGLSTLAWTRHNGSPGQGMFNVTAFEIRPKLVNGTTFPSLWIWNVANPGGFEYGTAIPGTVVATPQTPKTWPGLTQAERDRIINEIMTAVEIATAAGGQPAASPVVEAGQVGDQIQVDPFSFPDFVQPDTVIVPAAPTWTIGDDGFVSPAGNPPSPSPSPSPTGSPSPSPTGSPSPSPTGSPSPDPSGSPSPDPSGSPSPDPSGSPSPDPSASSSPSPSPSWPVPSLAPIAPANYPTAPNFLQYGVTVLSTKFPFDIWGIPSIGSGSLECPNYTFFGVSQEVCAIRDFVGVLKYPVIVRFLVYSVMSI